jgi:hypothetical protein
MNNFDQELQISRIRGKKNYPEYADDKCTGET